jgi:hypothetical protein
MLTRLRERLAWWLLVRATRGWANRHMDQWEQFAFRDYAGRPVYVTITLATDHPNTFQFIDP